MASRQTVPGPGVAAGETAFEAFLRAQLHRVKLRLRSHGTRVQRARQSQRDLECSETRGRVVGYTGRSCGVSEP